MKTEAEKQFPQCNEIADKITAQAVNKINAVNVNLITDNVPYVRQCILELLISKLEKLV